MKQEDIDRLRKASGEVSSDDPLVAFLYDLMRDHVTPGVVEKLTLDAQFNGTINYTNGHLANYAADVANRLRR